MNRRTTSVLTAVRRAAALVAATIAATPASAGSVGDSGEQVYLSIKIENVQVVSYQLGAFGQAIGKALAGAGLRYSHAEISAASREAVSGLSAALHRREGDVEHIVCLPQGAKKTCIRIVCQSCTAE